MSNGAAITVCLAAVVVLSQFDELVDAIRAVATGGTARHLLTLTPESH